MKTCPSCFREFDDTLDLCPDDGEKLFMARYAVNEVEVRPGTIIDGKYELQRQIGQGGMGTVYRARHVLMDSVVAVKLLRRDLVSDQNAIERFRREALAAARIRHPNAVVVTDFGVSEGRVYLVMEYLEGQDLRRRLRKMKRLRLEEAVRILAQVCSAVDLAHRKDLIHRDLKPDNILLVRDDETGEELVKVLDFGIAKLRSTDDLATLTERGAMLGTPYYMSPEQCRGESLDPRSDVYSLGVILYEMLTGEWPFKGDNPFVVGMKHQMQAPRPPRELNPSIPDGVEDLILKSLEKKPEDRPASAREFATSLLDAFEKARADGSLVEPIDPPFAQFESGPLVTAPPPTADTMTLVAETTPERTVGGATILAGAHSDVSEDPDTPDTHGAPHAASVVSVPPPAARPFSQVAWYVASAGGALVLVSAITFAIWRPTAGTTPVASVSSPDPPAQPVKPPAERVSAMVFVQGGVRFGMGTDSPRSQPDARPKHQETVNSFYIDAYEVTNEDYARYVGSTGAQPPPHWPGGHVPPSDERLPVTNVTWYEARQYAAWLGKRLPTEAEWEYAARGSDERLYPWGDTWEPGLANFKDGDDVKPRAVGSYPGGVSPFGIFDMASNVAEWTASPYSPYPSSKAKIRPGFVVIRGGAYNAPPDDLMVFNRFYDAPESRNPNVGFRCAK